MASDKASPTFTGQLTKSPQSFPDKPALSAGKFEISHSRLQELIDYSPSMLQSPGISPDDVVALFLHNSGTSRPKVIALTQHNLAVLVQSIASVHRMTDSDSTMVDRPLFYVHGLLGRLLSPLSAGGSVTLASLGQFSASTFWGDMHKPGSVDKPVGQELVVLDDKGVPQLTGVAGEVCIRWPNVTKGYKNSPEANDEAFLFRWLHTGHLGYLNEDGYLHLVGPVKELINSGVPVVDIPPPEGSEHNKGCGPRDEVAVDIDPPPEGSEHNTRADPNSAPNQSNEIWQLMYITTCNFVSNATVGVLYLGENLQGFHEPYDQRAELIASVGVPIAVAAGTFVASFLFASNPGKWSNWISGMSMINAGMTLGGPLSFNWVSK